MHFVTYRNAMSIAKRARVRGLVEYARANVTQSGRKRASKHSREDRPYPFGTAPALFVFIFATCCRCGMIARWQIEQARYRSEHQSRTFLGGRALPAAVCATRFIESSVLHIYSYLRRKDKTEHLTRKKGRARSNRDLKYKE